MKKLVKGRILGRESSQKRALMRSLARELFIRGKIQTTEAKAKEARRFVEKWITRGKKGDLASIRLLARHFDRILVAKLVKEIAPKYAERKGGYVRITKIGPRPSDKARMAFLELV